MCHTKVVYKNGELYSNVRSQIRPFDTIFFRGNAIFSKIVALLEEYGTKVPKSNDFTHVGMVVTSDILQHENVLPGKLYIFESTVGGHYGEGIKDVEGKTWFGVQLRCLDDLVPACDEPDHTLIAWGKLIHNPVDYLPMDELKKRFTAFFNVYNNKRYDSNVYDLLSSALPFMRPFRETIDDVFHTQDWYFCSEIVALAYKFMGIYPQYVNEKDVLPRDIGFPEADSDILMPKIIDKITYITTPLHYQPNTCKP